MSLPLEHKPDTANGHVAPGFLDELRAIYSAIDSDEAQTEVFDVEGSNVAIRYRRMILEERLKSQAPQDAKTVWERNAQFLIDACVEILRRDPETGELGPAIPGETVTFDFRPGETVALHQALGIEETNVRRSVLRVFQGVDGALLRHAEQVDSWMVHVEDKTAERFAGG